MLLFLRWWSFSLEKVSVAAKFVARIYTVKTDQWGINRTEVLLLEKCDCPSERSGEVSFGSKIPMVWFGDSVHGAVWQTKRFGARGSVMRPARTVRFDLKTNTY